MPLFVPSSWPPPPPKEPLDLTNAQVVANLFLNAAADVQSPLRRGAMVQLSSRGRLLMTGDLHDHGLNLRRIVKLAALEESPDHHVILHEVIHGPTRINGRDLSIRTLARVVALKLRYPNQVHFLMANHDLAQRNQEGILKGGANVIEAFDEGIEFIYNDRSPMIREALKHFLSSLPLAVRCTNGIFCSHSLPSPLHLDTFDPNVIHRTPTEADLASGGHAHSMVWGRRHTQKVADVLGETWGVKMFVMGHQPATAGYQTEGQSILILASDHDHGMALPIDLAVKYTQSELVERLIPLASVVV